MNFPQRPSHATRYALCGIIFILFNYAIFSHSPVARAQSEPPPQADDTPASADTIAATIATELGVEQDVIEYILADGVPPERIEGWMIDEYLAEMETQQGDTAGGTPESISETAVDDSGASIRAAAGQIANVTLESCSSQHFPFVFLNIGVTDNGLPVTGLNETNFACTENGTPQTDFFLVTPPETGDNVRLADIVFLIDASGSMRNEIAAVRANASAFAQSLAASDVDFRLGLVQFGNGSGPNPFVFNNGNLTDDVSQFESFVDTLGASGDREPGFLALRMAAAEFNFRTGSQKIFILISDEDSDDRDKQATTDLLLANDITVHTAVDCTEGSANSDYCDETSVRGVTGGLLFDVVGPYDQILNTIVARTASTYIVRYRSSNQSVDGTTRNVRCDVTGNNGQPLGAVQCAYVPGAAPLIRLTAETEQLNRTPVAEGSTPTIRAIVTDQAAPFVQQVMLFYRNTGSGSGYASLPMVPAGNDIYQATLPGLVTPGVDYYLRATDGQVTSQLPSNDPGIYPFQIAVLPNIAPEITHTPLTSAARNVALPVGATVADTTNRVARVELKWRYTGQLIYETRPMNAGNNNRYQASWTANEVIADIEYYIEATDDLGISSRSGTADAPHLITVAEVEPVIFIPGISGSRLYAGGEELWPAANLNLIARNQKHQKLTLDPDKANANVVATDAIREVAGIGVYRSILQSLLDAGYVEYQVDNQAARRTTSGCDYEAQRAQHPNLFVFAYDWRLDNAESAAALADYIGCIRQFYPASPINIVAHSMGGLVSRRYILDHTNENNITHGVHKLITIGTPWLGAPKSILALETGDFVPMYVASDSVIKDLAEFFPGAHQLIPSRNYFYLVTELDEIPFIEEGWDYNQNGKGIDGIEYYSATDLQNAMDQRYQSEPGSTTDAFHTQAQDDWNSDQTGVEYHVIYGINHHADTVGQLTAAVQSVCTSVGIAGVCYMYNELVPAMVPGDGTVPVLSSKRSDVNGTTSLYGPAYVYYVQGNAFQQNAPGITDESEHLGLTQNESVQQKVIEVLNPQFNAQAAGVSSAAATVVETAHYVELTGVADIAITDSAGNLLDAESSSLVMPSVTHHRTSPMSHLVVLDADQPYSITFSAPDTPLAISLREGTDLSTNSATRYRDLSLPAGAAVLLTVAPNGTIALRYDSNGTGVPNQVVAPTSSVSSGTVDITPPSLSIRTARVGNETRVTISAIDAESSVKAVFYSLDRTNFTLYTAPFSVPTNDSTELYVFADDTFANRSGLLTFSLAPQFDIFLPAIQNGKSQQPPENTVPGAGFTTVEILGPGAGITGESYAFNLSLALDPEAGPATIEWSPAPASGQGTASATYRWNSPGLKQINIVATSGRSSALISHYIDIASANAPTPAVPTTAVPTTAVPTTAVPTTPAPTTPVPTTLVPTTPAPTAPAPTTVVPTTAVPTPIPPTPIPPTPIPPTPIPPTPIPPTPIPPTPIPPTPIPPTPIPPTPIPPTPIPPTPIPPTSVPALVANNDTASVAEDSINNAISVLGNDGGGSGTLRITAVSDPPNGATTFTANQVFYTPTANFNGGDSFTYTIVDAAGSSATATVNVTVTPVNDAPVAQPQSAGTQEGAAVVITLSGSDIDGDTLTFSVASPPANGTLSGITAIGPTSATIQYTPNPGFAGSDSFTYIVVDAAGSSDTATVNITVTSVNDAPVAQPASASTQQDTPVVITLSGSDVDGDALTFSVISLPVNGTLSGITTSGSTSATIQYAPNPGFAGSDSFMFEVDDGNGGTDTATASIQVTAAPAPSRFRWAIGAASSTGRDTGYGVAVNGSGTIHTTGSFFNTVDFNPGAGTTPLTSNGAEEIFVAQYTNGGGLISAQSFGDEFRDWGGDITLDAAGSMYVTGRFRGSVDFDRGPATAIRTAVGDDDIFVLKLDSAGNYQWVSAMGGAARESSLAIAVDAVGGVYIAGYFNGTVDFDPGAGVQNRTSNGHQDFFVVKLDSLGRYVWAHTFGASEGDLGRGIGLDGAGNVYAVGEFDLSVDFDPGPGELILNTNGQPDAVILKLDPNGNIQWARHIGGSTWDRARDIAVDSSGNSYITGYVSSVADMDPGPGTVNRNTAGDLDIFVLKLDSNGNYQWDATVGSGGDDQGYGVGLDGAGGVYAVGYFNGTIDFDAGGGTASRSSNGGEDVFIYKLNTNGGFEWIETFGSSGADWGLDLNVRSADELYVMGLYGSTFSLPTQAGTVNLQHAGETDVFLMALE